MKYIHILFVFITTILMNTSAFCAQTDTDTEKQGALLSLLVFLLLSLVTILRICLVPHPKININFLE